MYRLYEFLDILQPAKHSRNAICTVTAQARTKIGDLGKALVSSSFLPSSVFLFSSSIVQELSSRLVLVLPFPFFC